MKVTEKKIYIDEQIPKIFELNEKCVNQIKNSIYQKNDARTMFFLLMSIDIQTWLLGLSLSKNLMRMEFYKENKYKTENINEDFMGNATSQFLGFMENSYFISIFVQLENYLRLIANHKGLEHNNISKTIENLSAKFGLSEENLKLCDILRTLRNSIHNGGFSCYNSSIIYKGKHYNFIKGNPINYGDIEFYIYITNEILENLIPEINQKTLGEALIEHNYANLEFEMEES